LGRKRFSRALWRLLAGIGCAVLAVSPASADRASLAIEQSVAGQSNLQRTHDDEQEDGSYEVRPRLWFERPVGDLQYLVEYSPTYDVYFETDGIDGFDQFGRGDISYSPWPTGTVSARTDLAYYRSIRSETIEGPTGAPEVTADASGRVFRALSGFDYEHSLSPTTVAKTALGLQAYEYSTDNNADSLGLNGELSLLHDVRPTLALGAFVFGSHRRFEELGFEPESENVVGHFGPMLRIAPTPTLTFEGQAGPAWVFTDRDASDPRDVALFNTASIDGVPSAAIFDNCGAVGGQPLLSQCPYVPSFFLSDFLASQRTVVDYPGGAQSQDDETFTGFAHVELRKLEQWGYGSLEYFRGEDASSGSGVTSIRDSLTATVELTMWANWSLRFRGNWNQREAVDRIDQADVAAGPSPFPSFFGANFAQAEGLVVVNRSRRKITQYWVDARLGRQITRALSAEVEVGYLLQDRSGAGSNTSDFDNWRGAFTLRYELPSIDY
jgi:hypothetical protein